MINKLLNLFFNVSEFATIIIALVVFIGICVYSFSSRYMKGDAQYRSFTIQLILIVFAVSAMVSVDNLIIFFIAWCLSNMLLVRLMIHKSSWKAAKQSGILAAKNYVLGAFCIGSACALLYSSTGKISIQAIASQDAQSTSIIIALVLMLIGAMTQSAIWPFHRWLLSSLNSPTPVSAIMHAGLVNGGGCLLVRFAPLYLQHPHLLTGIFLIGLTTSLIGTLWNLMQNDIKRMLACSTMGQMGFMFAQCGLGLFPAAVAHLVWHGMFKSYLFLASGSAAQEKRFDLGYPPKLFTLICSLLCGVAGSLSFGYTTGTSWLAGDTTLILMVIAFLTATQFALTMLQFKTVRNLPLTCIATIIIGFFYGMSVELITSAMERMQLMQPQPLNIFHIFGLVALTLSWLLIVLTKNQEQNNDLPSSILKIYVIALNSSQPHPETVTSHHNQYQY